MTIPDGTTIPAGQSFTKTWKVSNTGTCAWTATYQLVFISGDSLGGKATAIGKVVNPGESADVSVVLTSTSATGTITGTWKLSNDKGTAFGDFLYGGDQIWDDSGQLRLPQHQLPLLTANYFSLIQIRNGCLQKRDPQNFEGLFLI